MTAGIVLAAGAGRRFGGPKQLAPVGGRPMLAGVVETATAALDRVVVVLGAHAAQILAALPWLPHVLCEDWAEGQSASLRTGVAALGDREPIMVLLGDQPFLGARVIEAMPPLDGHDAVRATYGGVPGHPVLLGPAVLAEVPALRGDAGARELLGRFRVLAWEAGDLADPTDIDTPADLEAIR